MARQQVEFSIEQVAAVSAFLREPRSRGRRLLIANRKWLAELEHWRNCRQQEAALRRHVARLRFPQQESLQELVRADARSRLLVSFHFGDYIYGTNLLAASISGLARVFFLSHAPGSAAYFANMALAFGEHAIGPSQQLLANQASLSRVLPLLRGRGMQLITFCDLSGEFGGRAQVDFLYRAAWFSRGPAILSLTNRVPLLPVINWFDGDRRQLVLGDQMEPERYPGETIADAAGRMTNSLIRFFEPFFRNNPEQWRYLGILPLYFIQAGAAGLTLTKEENHASTTQDLTAIDAVHG